jgi:hypothetical protein
MKEILQSSSHDTGCGNNGIPGETPLNYYERKVKMENRNTMFWGES